MQYILSEEEYTKLQKKIHELEMRIQTYEYVCKLGNETISEQRQAIIDKDAEISELKKENENLQDQLVELIFKY